MITAFKHGLTALALCLFFSVSLIPSTQAGNAKKLTERDVRDFIIKTTKITNGDNRRISQEEVREYLGNHLHKEGFFKSIISYNIPGFPTQNNTLSLNKDQFTDSILNGQQTLEDYRTEVNVKNIRISKDGEKATVTTISREQGEMPVPGEGGDTELISVEGQSTCSQILLLNDEYIQMYSANCRTDINFMSPY
jgi:hypothetical protein